MKIDHFKIIDRAFNITLNYRALWIFGVIIALALAGGSSGGGGGGNSGAQFNGNGGHPGPGFGTEFFTPAVIGVLIAIALVLVLLALLYGIAVTIGRYVSESALIQMVNLHEETGATHTIKEGFKLGWSRSAWRIFLINLLIGLPLTLAFILLFVLSLSPLLLWITRETVVGILGTVTAIGLVFLVILLAIVIGIAVSTLQHFFWRTSVLEGRGVFESIREGFQMVKQNLKDVALMWLFMAVINFVIGIGLMLFFFLILILAAVVGLLPALLVGGLTSLFANGPWPWIAGAVVGVPLFILVLTIPTAFLGGLLETFKSTVWTLTYRELKAANALMNGDDAPLENITLLESAPAL